jgi:hypothetical protein
MSAAGLRAGSVRSAQAIHRPPVWYRDAAGCLQVSVGSALLAAGWDPLEVLGAGWAFVQVPQDAPYEEFYLPLPPGAELGQALAPHHALGLGWHTAQHTGRQALDELAEVLARGGLPIAAVDNYHLPFRPAYHDVHAAHLVIVYAVDGYRELVQVCDPTPPAFRGSVPVEHFLAAWQSSNPADEQDAFFSETAINGRFLVLEPPGVPQPLSPGRFADAMHANYLRFSHPETAADDGRVRLGLAGLRRYLSALDDAASAGDRETVRRVYPGCWSIQASTSLHGELLRARGASWRLPELIELGRAVERVAHAWTAVRVTAAHHWQDAQPVAGILRAQGRQLQERYQSALALMPAAGWRLAELAHSVSAGSDGARHGS